jgi:hypothetical protein
VIAALALALRLVAPAPAIQGDPALLPATLPPEAARASADRAIAWLVADQNPDGSWTTGAAETLAELGFSVESFYAWQVAAHAIACMALMEAPESSERRAALERGMAWLVEARTPQRGNDWDIDYVWAGLYGFVALVQASDDERFASDAWRTRVAEAGRRYFAILERNQIPTGGWAYYDFPDASQRPKWATSFCTSLVLPALARGEAIGWVGDAHVRERATRYVARCAQPDGSYTYSLSPIANFSAGAGGEDIDLVKGSLARIQVCNWGLASSGVRKITPERLREGLSALFEHHRFLDVAFARPIPHEAYYYNAGYFYLFGHYYAALVIGLLPEAEREGWHARLRPHLVKVQRKDGSTADFLYSSYNVVANTAYLALSLELGLPREPLAPANAAGSR